VAVGVMNFLSVIFCGCFLLGAANTADKKANGEGDR